MKGRRTIRAWAVIFWLLLWQAGAMAIDQRIILVSPLTVLARLTELVPTLDFWGAIGYSLVRITAGFLLGVAAGTLLAALSARFRRVEELLAPALLAIKSIPVASFIILLLLWVATNRVPTVCSALMVLPVVWGNVRKGVGETDPLLLEAARAYRFTAWKTVRLVYVPSVLPYFASGCSTALGLAWKAGIAAEVLCLPKTAIGTQIFNSKRYLETPDLFAWTLVVLLLSFLLDRVFGALFHRMERGRRG